MIEVHFAILNEIHWIGVDLNTTGHVAVAADPNSGKIVKLGKSIHNVHNHAVNNCTKLWKENKLWKLKKYKTKERKTIQNSPCRHRPADRILCRFTRFGYQVRKLFSAGYSLHGSPLHPFEFSFGNGSFFTLQKMVERRAYNRGIPVIYVNPAYTSKRCSRCGEIGRRTRKQFECPDCGFVAHADVNAAFNIATRPLRKAEQEDVLKMLAENFQRSKKQKMRRMMRSELPVLWIESYPSLQHHSTVKITSGMNFTFFLFL